jgi:hypothetical protein
VGGEKKSSSAKLYNDICIKPIPVPKCHDILMSLIGSVMWVAVVHNTPPQAQLHPQKIFLGLVYLRINALPTSQSLS